MDLKHGRVEEPDSGRTAGGGYVVKPNWVRVTVDRDLGRSVSGLNMSVCDTFAVAPKVSSWRVEGLGKMGSELG